MLVVCLVLAPAVLRAQIREITGKVSEVGTGTPITEATIGIVGGQFGTRTNERGEFRLRVPSGDVTVIAPNARRLRVFAGHAGWAPGQLADELSEGAWWVLPGSPDDLFTEQPREMWRTVLRRQAPPLSLISTFPADPTLN